MALKKFDKKWILVLFVLLFMVVFAVQNYEVVELRFWFWTFKTSLALVVFSNMFMGILIGWATMLLGQKRKRRKAQKKEGQQPPEQESKAGE